MHKCFRGGLHDKGSLQFYLDARESAALNVYYNTRAKRAKIRICTGQKVIEEHSFGIITGGGEANSKPYSYLCELCRDLSEPCA